MSGRELDPDGTASYHGEHPWEQVGHELYIEPDKRHKDNWPPVDDARARGPYEAAKWDSLPALGDRPLRGYHNRHYFDEDFERRHKVVNQEPINQIVNALNAYKPTLTSDEAYKAYRDGIMTRAQWSEILMHELRGKMRPDYGNKFTLVQERSRRGQSNNGFLAWLRKVPLLVRGILHG